MTQLRTISFDGIVIGGGGAGMRAALQMAQSGYKTAVITKVFPTRSHTVSAQGGITCAIASSCVRLQIIPITVLRVPTAQALRKELQPCEYK